MKLAIAVVAALLGTCEHDNAEVPWPAIAAIPRCVPEKTKERYVVCVIDEAGRAVAGADVHAVREGKLEGYGDVGFWEDDLGHARSDALGRAAFAVPRLRYAMFLSYAGEFSRRASATYRGWPTATAGDGGTIVVGPPRWVKLVTKRRTCSGDTQITLDASVVLSLGGGAVLAAIGPQINAARVTFCDDVAHGFDATAGALFDPALGGALTLD